MRFIKITVCVLFALSVSAVSTRAADPASQVLWDSSVASIIAQRTFAGTLPSIADYSQTAHSVLKDGEYCPVDSLTGASYCQPGAKWVMWDTPFMQFDKMDKRGRLENGDPKYNGWEMDMSGFGTGIGRMLNDTTVVGLAVGWDSRKLDMDTLTNGWSSTTGDATTTGSRRSSGKDRSDAFHAALYGGTAIGCFFVDAYAGFSRTWHRGRMDDVALNDVHIGLGVNPPFRDYHSAVTEKTTAKYSDTVYSAGVKASYVWILPNEMRITSSLGLDYARLTRGKVKAKYTGRIYQQRDDAPGEIEQFDPSAYPVKKATQNSLQTPVSVAINKTFQSDFLAFKGKPSWWTPEFRAGYTPQFGGKRVSSKASYDGIKYFTMKSSEIESYGTVGAGVKIKLADKYIFAVDYDYRFGRDYRSHLVTGTYGVSF